MDPRSKIKCGIGWIIADCLWLLIVIIDLCSGETTADELAFQIMLSVILGVLAVALLWRYRRKDRQRYSPGKSRKNENTEDH